MRLASYRSDAPETDDPAADLRVRLQLVRDRLGVGDTFVFSHLKATDAAGHTKDPAVKQRTIEVLDSELRDLPTERSIVCVTGDHATPAYPRSSTRATRFHSSWLGRESGPIPSTRSASSMLRGILGHLRGPDLMPLLLNAADRPLFLGSRPTPFRAPMVIRPCSIR